MEIKVHLDFHNIVALVLAGLVVLDMDIRRDL
jgi:hypothetical protein